jgi:hypothetical protein
MQMFKMKNVGLNEIRILCHGHIFRTVFDKTDKVHLELNLKCSCHL